MPAVSVGYTITVMNWASSHPLCMHVLGKEKESWVHLYNAGAALFPASNVSITQQGMYVYIIIIK